MLSEALLTFEVLSSEEPLQRSRCAVVPSSNDAAYANGKSFRSWGLGKWLHAVNWEQGAIEATPVVVGV